MNSHLADLLSFPESVRNNLEAGGFVMSISGNNWSYIALDEAHEMTVNKDVKEVMSVGSMSGIASRMCYMPYRATLIKNLCDQLFVSKPQIQSDDYGKLFEDTETNIKSYIKMINESEYSLSDETSTPNDTFSHILDRKSVV